MVTEFTLREKMLGKQVGPLYLESSSLGSKRLYNRVGFVDRAEMVYGKCKDGETATADEKGKMLGGRLFAMTWMP